jgi:hypothetical protein
MYGGSFESRTVMLTNARRDRGSHRIEISRFSKITRNTARVITVHMCASQSSLRLGTRRIVSTPRAKAAQLFAFSNARVRDGRPHLSARAAHLLPVSRPRCQDGAGDRPPERGRPLCQLRRLRERRRGRRKRRGQGGASESRTMPRAFLFSARRGPAPATASAVPPPASSR